MSALFSGRWVSLPEHASEQAEGRLPAGFRAGGVAAGIKESGARDVAMIVCDAPEVTSAARFTASGLPAPPVQLTRQRTRLASIRAVVVNAGNANAATGRRGYEDAARMQGGGAMVAGVAEDRVAVCSTGVIGVPLPMDRVNRGIAACSRELGPDAGSFAAAIRTTDAIDKHASLAVRLPSGTVTVSAQCKGAGMISPNLATLLCFVQTDAVLSAATCELLLGVCVKRSFQRISVDGQLSTNDTVILQASGAAGVAVAPHSEDELRLGEAIDALMRGLALAVVRDGEGAKRIGRITVRGGDADHAERAARAVADSPLVKTALYGGDANWGRIAQAVGAALPLGAEGPLSLEVAIEGVTVCRASAAVDHDALALAEAVQGPEVEYAVTLAGEGAEAEVFFSDLGHEYVVINAEYTT